ncbi:hypothetical protein HWV07_03275 [Natronomonas salina]|uniref:hypothetical protein n=1 Tax=Natronomonas salina TaxID=1710540 RepID=UPI0015B40F8E|nr:hypothetical protein [Natronomonas salina]QLD88110.1 hypothetical protein HWV07_03275 [Natronomonas salina]
MRTVTTRLSEADAETLAELEAEWDVDRTVVLRRLIRDGLANWQTERALEQLADYSVSIRKAAETADVSYVEMVTLAAEEGIDVGYSTQDLERDLDRI